MEFRQLGPLEVRGDDGAEVSLGGARPRALLALLLLHPNQAVSTDRLIDGIWGDAPPASARTRSRCMSTRFATRSAPTGS